MSFEEKIKAAKKALEGKEMNFVEIDNEMMEIGFHTEFDSGLDFDEITESGCILYTNNDTDESGTVNADEFARIEFFETCRHGEDEDSCANYVKIKSVSAQ